MFIRPQHFQLQDAYFHSLLHKQPSVLGPFRYGFTRLAINDHLLVQGKVSLVTASGHLEEGIPFSCPDQDKLPNAKSIPEGAKDQLVYLCITSLLYFPPTIIWAQDPSDLCLSPQK